MISRRQLILGLSSLTLISVLSVLNIIKKQVPVLAVQTYHVSSTAFNFENIDAILYYHYLISVSDTPFVCSYQFVNNTSKTQMCTNTATLTSCYTSLCEVIGVKDKWIRAHLWTVYGTFYIISLYMYRNSWCNI